MDRLPHVIPKAVATGSMELSREKQGFQEHWPTVSLQQVKQKGHCGDGLVAKTKGNKAAIYEMSKTCWSQWETETSLEMVFGLSIYLQFFWYYRAGVNMHWWHVVTEETWAGLKNVWTDLFIAFTDQERGFFCFSVFPRVALTHLLWAYVILQNPILGLKSQSELKRMQMCFILYTKTLICKLQYKCKQLSLKALDITCKISTKAAVLFYHTVLFMLCLHLSIHVVSAISVVLSSYLPPFLTHPLKRHRDRRPDRQRQISSEQEVDLTKEKRSYNPM